MEQADFLLDNGHITTKDFGNQILKLATDQLSQTTSGNYFNQEALTLLKKTITTATSPTKFNGLNGKQISTAFTSIQQTLKDKLGSANSNEFDAVGSFQIDNVMSIAEFTLVEETIRSIYTYSSG